MQHDVKSIIAYMEGLEVTQGDGLGESFKVLPWQRTWLESVLAPDADPVSALSLGRGNGKTTLLAALCCAFLDGPARAGGSDIVLVASSFQQGKVCFRHVLSFLEGRYGGDLGPEWRVADNNNDSQISNKAANVRLRVLGSDPKRAHGLAPSLLILDEPAQWTTNQTERMFAALRTSLGKIPGARLLIIGTRSDHSDHFFSRILRDSAASRTYAADKEDDPQSPETWKKANPSMSHFPTLRDAIAREASDAEKDPQLLHSFRALRLNLGVSDTREAYVMEPETWERCEVAALPKRAGGYALGVDLGGSAAMSACAAYWPRSRRLEVAAAFSRLPSLERRALVDGEPGYPAMVDRGELLILGEHTADVRALLRECLGRWGTPAVIAGDRWRQSEFFDALDQAGVPKTLYEPRGMGWKDAGEDVARFQRACLDGAVKIKHSLLLRSAIANSRLTYSPSGSMKLAKANDSGRRAQARDDALNASIVAVSAGLRNYGPGRKITPSGKRRVRIVTA